MVRREYYPREKVDRAELKRDVLRAMCECAETIRKRYPYIAESNLVFDRMQGPVGFKAGTMDKLLFRKIINENFETILDAFCCAPMSEKLIGARLLVEKYYSSYGEFRKYNREELLMSTGKGLGEYFWKKVCLTEIK